MRKKAHPGSRQTSHNITVRAIRRDPPDLHRLARALLQLAKDQVAQEQAAGEAAQKNKSKQRPKCRRLTTTPFQRVVVSFTGYQYWRSCRQSVQ